MYEYFREIVDGLERIMVFYDHEAIPFPRGVELWAEKAKHIDDGNGKMFFCGNGASCTMAEHMSHDWFQNAGINTYTCSETAHLTAIANDLDYDEVFAFRISRIMTSSDMLITISSSGNSGNIIRAIEEAKKKQAFVVTISGKESNNRSVKAGDLNFYVPLDTYGLVESAHAVLLHCVLDYFLERYRGGRH